MDEALSQAAMGYAMDACEQMRIGLELLVSDRIARECRALRDFVAALPARCIEFRVTSYRHGSCEDVASFVEGKTQVTFLVVNSETRWLKRSIRLQPANSGQWNHAIPLVIVSDEGNKAKTVEKLQVLN